MIAPGLLHGNGPTSSGNVLGRASNAPSTTRGPGLVRRRATGGVDGTLHSGFLLNHAVRLRTSRFDNCGVRRGTEIVAAGTPRLLDVGLRWTTCSSRSRLCATGSVDDRVVP